MIKNYSLIVQNYLNEHRMSPSQLAHACHISTQTIWNLLYERYENVHALTAYKLEKGTNGGIKYEELTDTPRKPCYIERNYYKPVKKSF